MLEAESDEGHEVTDLLDAWSRGDQHAFDVLVTVVYEDLRRIAHNQLAGERADHTLNTEALVHESYLNLAGKPGTGWRNRAQFFAVASRAMRRILVDHARVRRAEKRGGERTRVTWSGDFGACDPDADNLLALNDALERLAERDHQLLKVVECRFFGGLSVAETAEALGRSTRSVERDWTRARAYLYQLLDLGEREPSG
jgi:RNA polymerase sigma factor (TIGR02999 family)